MTKELEGNANKARSKGFKGTIWEVLESINFLSLKLEGLAASLQHEEANYFNVGIETGW
jgi:hypothetical protein